MIKEDLIKRPDLFCKECLKNAERFIRDAKILIKDKSYAHSIVSSLFALEEISKANLINKRRIGKEELFLSKKECKILVSHRGKTCSVCDEMIWGWLKDKISGVKSKKELPEKLDDKDNKKEFEKIEYGQHFILNMHAIREWLLYVDIQKGNTFSPFSFGKKKYATQTLKIVEEELKNMEDKSFRHYIKKGL